MFNFTELLNQQIENLKEQGAPVNVMSEPGLFEPNFLKEESNFENAGEFEVNRTEKQTNNRVAYDIGTVAGSRKELAALKKAYLENKNRDDLAEIALIDDLLAFELATKKNLFSWFSMENCKARKVEVKAAYGISLIIRRIPADSKGMDREAYLNAIEFMSNELYQIQTMEELFYTLHRWCNFAINDATIRRYEARLHLTSEKVAEYEKLEECVTGEYKRLKNVVSGTLAALHASDYRDQYPLHLLKGFADFISSTININDWRKSVNKKYETWDDYDKVMEERLAKKKENGTTKKKSVWERPLPVNPVRKSDVETPLIMIPEDYVAAYKFRANQMGHWMKDSDALGHLRNSSSGFTDLAYILNIPLEAVSFKGSLAMAFGARGIGRALAHFERGKQRNVINMTKKNGSLGVLAHEWFHGLDYFLRCQLEDGNPYDEMLSEMSDESSPYLDSDLWLVTQNLISSMKEGQCTDFYEVDQHIVKSTPVTSSSELLFATECHYDMQQFVDKRMESFDIRMANTINGYLSESVREKTKKRFIKRRKDELKKVCHIAAHLHFKYTNEMVNFVAYTVNESSFYNKSKKLDGKRKPYWSTNVEMAARAFEAYIQSKLEELDMQNDYLVAGAYGYPYPEAEERKTICKAFDEFFKVVRPYLID